MRKPGQSETDSVTLTESGQTTPDSSPGGNDTATLSVDSKNENSATLSEDKENKNSATFSADSNLDNPTAEVQTNCRRRPQTATKRSHHKNDNGESVLKENSDLEQSLTTALNPRRKST